MIVIKKKKETNKIKKAFWQQKAFFILLVYIEEIYLTHIVGIYIIKDMMFV
ncbi:hypothetical protein HMPREF3182_00165 [Megasphaera hutchinsoni]|uniref:Uncharacterized protein n=1 Tax=Megasphaera hutchinsoni TaxID=1588748 RepID=A0A134CLE4_9FIRM|nr:hypothetical protein HMPREF3182_00165 [Megasphaera hutchinsoni]